MKAPGGALAGRGALPSACTKSCISSRARSVAGFPICRFPSESTRSPPAWRTKLSHPTHQSRGRFVPKVFTEPSGARRVSAFAARL